MKNGIAFVGVAVALVVSACGGDFTIAERGKSPACVIATEGDGPSLDYAASELRTWTEKLVGVRLETAKGVRTAGKRVLLRLDPKGDDAFTIRTTDSCVEIVGGKRGVLFGVYELLEAAGGIRWLSSETTVIPKADRFVVSKGFRRDEKPAFELREGYWRDLTAHPDFAVRLRFNGGRTHADAKLGDAACVYSRKLNSCHTLYRLVPPEEFFKTHPEYFGEVKGKRLNGLGQLCLSNPDVLRIVTGRVLAEIRENPQYDFYGVSQMDWDNYCTCPKCRAIDEEEGSPAGSVIRFVNKVAEAVEREFPDKMIETLAYRYSRKPPKTAPRKNVLICLCSDNLNRAEPLVGSDSPANVAFRETLTGWGKLTHNIYLWDYVTDFAHYLNAMPNTLALGANIRFFRDNGVRYLFEQGDALGNHADFAELKAYLIGKFSWNPDLPLEPLLDEFFTGYYGKAAPLVRQYFDEVHALPHPQPMGMYESPDASWRSDAFLALADDLWKRAMELVKDDPVRLKNVRMGRAGTVYAILHRNLRDFIGVWCTREPEKFRARAEKHREHVLFLDACRKEGAPLRPVENVVRNRRMEKRLDQLVKALEVPAKGADRAVFRYDTMSLGYEWFRKSGVLERVKAPGALTGEAARLITASKGRAMWIDGPEMALDAGAKYRLRVRLKAVSAEGRSNPNDEVVLVVRRSRKNPTRVLPGDVILRRKDLKDGWAWYDCMTFVADDDNRFALALGRYRENPGFENVYVDSFEVVRLDDAQGADCRSLRKIELSPAFGTNGAFTVGCWIKNDDPAGYPDTYSLLYRGSALGFLRVQFDLRLHEGRPEFFYSSPYGNRLGLRHTGGGEWLANDGRRIKAKNLPKVPRGAWCHVAASLAADGGMALYLDGKPFFSGKRCGTNPPMLDCPVLLGRSEVDSGVTFHRFPGGIARPFFMSRTLTDDEIAARVAAERACLDPNATFGLGLKPMDFREKLPLVADFEANHRTDPDDTKRPHAFGRTVVDGLPALTIDGQVVPVLAAMPSPYVKPDEAAKAVRDFRAAGVKITSDIIWTYGKLNDWWLGEGKYDFSKLDAKAEAELAASPGGYWFPRVKLDPPDWWAKQHPEEMAPEHVKPDSKLWNALWPRMLVDVIDHFERAPYGGRIIGYQFGALIGSEWIVRAGPPPEWTVRRRGDLAPASADIRPLWDWRAARALPVSDVVRRAARLVKERTQGRKLTGLFFGYGLPEHAGFDEFLRSPDIDWFCSPTTYNGRAVGEPGRYSNNFQASCRLHGKLYWDECDLRTHLYHRPSDWRHRNEEESVNALKRAFGWSWAHGNGIWWFCLEGNGMFHSEEMMETVKAGVTASEVPSSASFAADVAVFEDPVFVIPNSGVQALVRERFERCILPKSGVAWDMYHISDVESPNLPDYRVYVFLNACRLTAAQRAAIRRLTRRKGVTALFFGAPGYYNGAQEGVSEVSDLVGVALKDHVFQHAQAAVAEGTGGLCLRLPRVFVSDDPKAKVFGRYRGWPVSLKKAHSDGSTTVLMPAPPEADELRALFRKAGAHVWLDTADTLGAGRDTVMVHAAAAGEKTVRLPAACDLQEAFTGKRLKNASEIHAKMRAGETLVWRLVR